MINNPYKSNRLEGKNESRRGVIVNTLSSVDTVELANCGGVVLEVTEGFLCHNKQKNPFPYFVNDMVVKRELY